MRSFLRTLVLVCLSLPLAAPPARASNCAGTSTGIAQQLDGDPALNYDPANGPVVAPWLSWGPYLWADGLNARSDGLTWACSELNASDGTHPSATGRLKMADSLLAFVRRDAATAPWYTIPGTLGAPRPGTTGPRVSLSLAPNPSRGGAEIALSVPAGVRWRLVVVDPSGRLVDEAAGVGTGSQQRPATAFSMGTGSRPGSYFVSLEADRQRVVRRVVIVGMALRR